MAKINLHISITGLKTIKGGEVADNFEFDLGDEPDSELLSNYYEMVTEFNEAAHSLKGK